MSSNPKVKSEAQRALVNIKSYNLKVFAITVNLGAINLVDIDEETEKKNKGKKNSTDDGSAAATAATGTGVADDLRACMELIQANAPTCSILLISETVDTLRILASSVNPDLKAIEWGLAAASAVQGKVISGDQGDQDEKRDTLADLIIKMNEGASSLKEKENALAANFAFLRKQGLSEESDDEDNQTFSLDDI